MPDAERVRAKKVLGQHFLRDQHAAGLIVDLVTYSGPGEVVEIGPGMGVLTRGLLARYGAHFHCLELDRESVAYLRENLPDLGERLHHADCLRFDYAQLPGPLAVLVGNLPYNISSQILFLVHARRDEVQECVFMLQREVASRIASPPGGREYGILSVLLQAYFDIRVELNLPPEAFSPPPRVHSSVITMRRNDVRHLDCDEVLLKRVVKGAFNQRRKTLRNSLGASFPWMRGVDFPFSELRPEALGVGDFVRLTNVVEDLGRE